MTKTAAATKEKKDSTTNSKQMFINKVKINNDNTASSITAQPATVTLKRFIIKGKEK